VVAAQRPHPALAQEEALRHVHARYRPDEDMERMILNCVADPDYRKALVADLRAHAVPARAPHFAPEDR
jgi:hypothetical protein